MTSFIVGHCPIFYIMPVTRQQFEDLLFNGLSQNIRYTQDSPIYPDVWLEYFDNRGQLATYRADLILLPHRDATASELFKELQRRLIEYESGDKTDWRMASNGETVVVCLTLDELINVALPLTKWHQYYLWEENEPTLDQYWLQEIIGALYAEGPFPEKITKGDDKIKELLRASFPGLLNLKELRAGPQPFLLWSISRNREASITIERSVPITKADACRRLFDIDGSGITWAVLDTGIDASHKAFRKIDPKTGEYFGKPFGLQQDPLSNQTRIVASYDFSGFRQLLSDINRRDNIIANLLNTSGKDDKKLDDMQVEGFIKEIETDLAQGRMLDWNIVAPLLRIPHNEIEYKPPVHSHGTHVAGILGAGLTGKDVIKPLVGMCPRINLYDIRVMDNNGVGSEFNILAAIQFIRWLNNQRNGQVIHGINISLSMRHEVASFACGQTPICDACERLVAEGTIVVAAAGNLGQSFFQDQRGSLSQGFRMVNITDPGNAENVITVGSTHREKPHTYGVSYFSSKGPTGDGRIKPDIVAPGEKIVSAFIGDKSDRLDGTSMAAPHVSGAAALLIAKNRELIGRPKRVKEILCKTATDLGREKYFQGCGMVDVLRALQSV